MVRQIIKHEEPAKGIDRCDLAQMMASEMELKYFKHAELRDGNTGQQELQMKIRSPLKR